MEPIKGGTLAQLPPDAAAPLNALDADASAASWALRWAASHKNVKVVLSGMSAEDQLDDNLATFGDFRPMTDAENAAIRQTADVLRSHIKIGCTGCRYCMPCPMGVDIPTISASGTSSVCSAIRTPSASSGQPSSRMLKRLFTASAAASVRPSAPSICRFGTLLQSSRRNWTIL